LVQAFARIRPNRVLSMILNNTFCDTQFFHDNAPCAAMFSVMPEFMLKRVLLQNFPTYKMEQEIANSVDFMVEQLESMPGSELASRLILNTLLSDLKPGEITTPQDNITILDTLDDSVLPEKIKEEVFKYYPNARVAQLKTGGNFPYLSRADEVNLHIEVHLRKQGLTGSLNTKPTDQNSNNNSVLQNGKEKEEKIEEKVESSSGSSTTLPEEVPSGAEN